MSLIERVSDAANKYRHTSFPLQSVSPVVSVWQLFGGRQLTRAVHARDGLELSAVYGDGSWIFAA